MSEKWFREQMYCPACGSVALEAHPNNRPVADFFCSICNEDYELKSKSGRLPAKLVDGSFVKMMQRLAGAGNPNLVVLSYTSADFCVDSVQVIPKQFFVETVIGRRRPLAKTARRPGWIGCNILLDQISPAARIAVVQDRKVAARSTVLQAWRRLLPFRGFDTLRDRGWAVEVWKVVEQIPGAAFNLGEVYAHTPALSDKFPGNNNVHAKIRQQLQVLRDVGLIHFLGDGNYRKL